ncbi:MAG: hypothetical protein ACI307_02640 [Sodaliphilus sp.]
MREFPTKVRKITITITITITVFVGWGFDAAFGLNTFAVFPLWHETKKKVGFAEKKTAPAEFRPEGSHHVPHSVHYIQPVSGLPQPTHSEAHLFDFAIFKLRFRLRLSLAWSCPRYAISDGSFALGLAAGGGEKDGGG